MLNTLDCHFLLQDMKLLDFTGRKVDPSLMMGFKENKKDEDPTIKVSNYFLILGILRLMLNITNIMNLRSIEPTSPTFLWFFTSLKKPQRRH